MPRYDFTTHRLFLDAPLSAGARVPLSREQANYAVNVLRLTQGSTLLVFNGRDGEWSARLSDISRKNAVLTVENQTREQTPGADLHYLFAPLKHGRLDYMIQKAVEMGAGLLRPVLTRRTQVSRINLDRMRANVIEAAEQCGILTIPRVEPETRLDRLLASWTPERLMVWCDEDAGVQDPIADLRARIGPEGPPPLAVLIGPEGGFDDSERAGLRALPNLVRLSLGPRILRADTAAVSSLALVQACLGDWRARA